MKDSAKVLQSRFVAKNEASLALTKCFHFYWKELSSSLLSENIDHTNLTERKQELLFELQKFNVDIQKYGHIEMLHEKETSYHHENLSCENNEICRLKEEIESLRNDMELSKRNRTYIQEYNVLTKMINSQPSREESQAKISSLEEELEQLHKRDFENQKVFDLRTKQFALLFHALNQLEGNLSNDSSDIASMDIDDSIPVEIDNDDS